MLKKDVFNVRRTPPSRIKANTGPKGGGGCGGAHPHLGKRTMPKGTNLQR